jgi:hypothetical protein
MPFYAAILETKRQTAQTYRMELIERKVSRTLSLLPNQRLLSDPAIHQVARLAVLSAIVNSKRTKPAGLKRAKEFFQRKLDEYVTSGCFRTGGGLWKSDPVREEDAACEG